MNPQTQPEPRDVVKEYLDRVRGMHPSEQMLRAIDKLEAEHKEEKRIKPGFRSNKDAHCD